MKIFIILMLLINPAIAQSISDTDLTTAMTECIPNKLPSREAPRWKNGWEHCDIIKFEFDKRNLAKLKNSNSLSPSVSKDIAIKLKATGNN